MILFTQIPSVVSQKEPSEHILSSYDVIYISGDEKSKAHRRATSQFIDYTINQQTRQNQLINIFEKKAARPTVLNKSNLIGISKFKLKNFINYFNIVAVYGNCCFSWTQKIKEKSLHAKQNNRVKIQRYDLELYTVIQ